MTKLQQLLFEITDKLDADGFVLLEQFCDDDFIQQILDVSRVRTLDIQKALAGREIGIGSAAGFDEIVQRSPGRWDIPISPQQFGFDESDFLWLPLIHKILGADAESTFSGVVFSDPNTPAQCWHTDSPHISEDHLPPHALNVMVALQAISMEMGPTEVARGSHILTNHLCNPALVVDQLIYQHAGTTPNTLTKCSTEKPPEPVASALAKGSCLIFDDRLLHRGLANRSAKTRYMAYFSYRRKGYSENTHFEARRSVFEMATEPES